MSQKQVKKFKRILKRTKGHMTHKILDELCDCGFWLRVRIAWNIIKGKAK